MANAIPFYFSFRDAAANAPPITLPISAKPTVTIENRKPRSVQFGDLPAGSMFLNSMGELRQKVHEAFYLGSPLNVLNPQTGHIQFYQNTTSVTPVSSVHIQVKE